jgi:atypical dual specificity phosphatase
MNTEIDEGKFTKEQLKSMLQKKSQFYDGPLEGIYFRVDDDKYLKDRAKVVRHDFLTHNGDGEVEHWSKAKLVKNIVKYT